MMRVEPQPHKPPNVASNRMGKTSRASERRRRRKASGVANSSARTGAPCEDQGFAPRCGLTRAAVCDWPVCTVAVMGSVSPRFATLGFTVQTLPAGAPEHEKATAPERPCNEVSCREYVAVAPLAIVALAAPLVVSA
jgi:hypothetical protein